MTNGRDIRDGLPANFRIPATTDSGRPGVFRMGGRPPHLILDVMIRPTKGRRVAFGDCGPRNHGDSTGWHHRQGVIRKQAPEDRTGDRNVHHLLGPIRARAVSVCRDALARAEALGMRPLVVRCQETLGELRERAGNLDRAQITRVAAAELRRELGLRPCRRFTALSAHDALKGVATIEKAV